MRHYCRRRRGPPRPRLFNPRLQRLFGQIALELGDGAERRVDEALKEAQSKGTLPSWLIDWVWQEKFSAMDKRGIDFMFRTDVGPIFLQVKSSRRNAREFEREHPNGAIITVVVNVCDPPMIIYGQVIGAVAKQRDKFLELRVVQ